MERSSDNNESGVASGFDMQAEISGLAALARQLITDHLETYESEAEYECSLGGATLRETCLSDGAETSSTVSVDICGPWDEDNEEYPAILSIGFKDDARPYLYHPEFRSYGSDEINRSAEICTALITEGHLKSHETSALLKIIEFLYGELQGREVQDGIAVSNGKRITCATAIGRIIASRNPDFMVTTRYDRQTGSGSLSVIAHQKSDPEKFDCAADTVIETIDRQTGEFLTLMVEGDTATAAQQTTFKGYHSGPPNKEQIESLKASVEVELLDASFEGVPKPAEDWRQLVEAYAQLAANNTTCLASETQGGEDICARLKKTLESRYLLERPGMDELLLDKCQVFNMRGTSIHSVSDDEVEQTATGHVPFRYHDIAAVTYMDDDKKIVECIGLVGERHTSSGLYQCVIPLTTGLEILQPGLN